MTAAVRWIVQRVGAGTLLHVALLYIALGCVAFGLAGVVQDLNISLLIWTTITAVLFAWVVARSRIGAGWAAAGLLGLGVIFVIVLQGQMGKPLVILGLRTAQYLNMEMRWLLVKNALPPDPTLLSLAALDLQAKAASLSGHFSAWLSSLARGSIAFDPLVNAILWGFLVWVVSSWAAWQIRRCEQPLRALLPASALLAGVLNFVRPNPFILSPVVAVMFILMIIIAQQKRERRWHQEKIDYTTEIRVDTAFYAIPVLYAILIIAVLTPSISVHNFVDLARRLFENQSPQIIQVGKSLGLNPVAGNGYFSHGQTGAILPQLHLLGSGPELSKKIFMEVKVSEAFSQNNPEGPYYWRSLTYDQYTGAGWQSSNTRVLEYRAGDQLVSSSVPDHRLVQQDVQLMQVSNGPLYYSGELVAVDRAYQAAWRLPLETGPDMFGASIAVSEYSAKSLVPVVSQDELRLAGTNYPDWVKERYLELPTGIPERVMDLANSLTHNQPSVFDEAVAIQDYLRTYTYTLDLPAPPINQDIADYFLFDLRKGYCDYYATAMVVLARAAGIPARFVTGFASGEFDRSQGKYIVTEADAHSWSELYFPKYGWVEFEPTASRPSISLPERLIPSENQAAGGDLAVIGWLRQLKPAISWTGVIILIILILTATGWQMGKAWRLRSLRPAQAAAHIYSRFRKGTRQLDPSLPPGETPFELSVSVATRIKDLNKGKIWLALYKPVTGDADQIVNFYAQAEYSQHALLPEQKIRAVKAWERLGWRLQLARFWGKIGKR